MRIKIRCFMLACGAAMGASGLFGCASDDRATQTVSKAADVAPTESRAGAELWAENCSRCHYARSPASFSEAQWETIVQHMRVRANLTGQEARAITEFLKAGT